MSEATPHKASPAEIVPPEQAPKSGPPAVITERDDNPIEGAVTPFEGDYMEITVDVANHLAEYEKGINTILNFIIRRTYPGDWVSHSKDGEPIEERTASPSSAAMERVARDIGVQESARTQPEKIVEDGGHYRYECVGKFTFRGRTVEAKGVASTHNPFHLAKAGGDPTKIREEYLIQECWRDCTKQGVKGLFGLRRIPITKLQELGYDVSKIKYVNFKSKEGSQSFKNPEATAKPQGAESVANAADNVLIHIEEMLPKTSKNGKSFYTVKATNGTTYYAWGDKDSDMIKKLLAALHAGDGITVQAEGGKYPTIKAVVPS